MKTLVSGCLLGLACRYDGASKPHPKALEIADAVPFCPECMGGLPTPRPPAEIRGDRVINAEGTDVTPQYRKGAEEALRLCRLLGIQKAVLKAKSPSCGCGLIYDGTFSRTLTPGNGITAALLLQSGVEVITEDDL
ncbi:MAG: DUF523 domain-containing protein [Clostridia bacterium]|nr:DUF523 domain-containing protein [Clostridia bacterium]